MSKSLRMLNIAWAVSIIVIIAAAGAAHAALIGAGGKYTPPTPAGWGPWDMSQVKVAHIAQVTIQDVSWDQMFWEALQRAQEEHGFQLDYTEGLYYGDYERVMRDYFARGYNVVVLSLGILVEEQVIKVAEAYPDRVILSGCSVIPLAPNVAAVCADAEESGYLAGMAAAWLTKTGKVGMVGGMKIACCLKYYRGFQFGAEAMAEKLGKDVEYLEVMVNDYNDIQKAYESALSLIDQGVDIFSWSQNIAVKGCVAAANERGVLGIGNFIDQNFLDPDTVVTSAKWVFPMKSAFDDLAAGTFYPAKVYYEGLEADYDRDGNGIYGGYDGEFAGYYTGLWPFHEFETKIEDYEALKAELVEAARQIATGELVVPRIFFE